MVIEVTADDIESGIPLHSEKCAIASALSRYGFIKPEVRLGEARIVYRDKRGKKHALTIPKNALDFAYRFDDEKHVEPFSFRLRKLGK